MLVHMNSDQLKLLHQSRHVPSSEHSLLHLLTYGTQVCVTFVLLLDLLVSCSLSEVGQDLGQFGDHNVIGGQSRLSLRDTKQNLCNKQTVQPSPHNPLMLSTTGQDTQVTSAWTLFPM